jgi:putative nucleotidyltransferase with HDIG domain
MRLQTRLFVFSVCVLALAWTIGLCRLAPEPSAATFADVLLLGIFALAAEGLNFVLPRSATSSMAFIPYLSLALIAPNWECVVAITLVRIVVEFRGRRPPLKQVFNTASHALMAAITASTYLLCGGVSFLRIADISHVAHVTSVVGAPTLVASVAGLFTNNLLVTAAVSLSTGRRFRSVWIDNHRSMIGVDLLATPLVFVFTWVYAAFGVILTATLWVPILGLRQLQRTNLELEKTNQELLELMVKSLEARDAYTSGHSRRVHKYSITIARAIGLSEREVEHVGKAALLHDVGKIHEKYAAVLAKQDRLTQEEWALIREHPTDGANLVSTMTHLRDIVPAIRHHHENWDGTGYPDALSGESIPLASRIIRFADTMDAMTTERPYRGPLSEAEVRSEFIRCSGTQFDPEIAKRLLSSALWPTLFASTTLPGQSILRVLPKARHTARRRAATAS